MRILLFTLFLLIALFEVNAQDGCDCTAQIDEQLRPIIEQRDGHHRDVQTLLQQRDQLIKERDEVRQTSEAINKSREAIFQEKEDALRALHEHRDALMTMEKTKNELQAENMKLEEALERNKADREHFQQVAQENQHYMQEYKVRLATMRDKSAKLDIELETAHAKIRELESATLVVKVKQEVAAAYESLLMLIGKRKDDDKVEDL